MIESGDRSILGVPLLFGERVGGGVFFSTRREHWYDETDVEIASTIAALVLANADGGNTPPQVLLPQLAIAILIRIFIQRRAASGQTSEEGSPTDVKGLAYVPIFPILRYPDPTKSPQK